MTRVSRTRPEDRETADVLSFGRHCAVGAGVAFAIAAGATLLDPSFRARSVWPAYVMEPGWFLLARFATLAAALLALGVVPAVEISVRGSDGGGGWLARLGILAFFAAALVNVQAASPAMLYALLDMTGRLWLAGIAVWVAGVSLAAWKARVWTGALGRGGIGLSVALLSLVASLEFQADGALRPLIALIGIGLCAWFVAVGRQLGPDGEGRIEGGPGGAGSDG